eukprot:CAMPEP_0203674748 /NCGR_PEP_ID=MMETSP0090-20130426/17117_1 /ASSEMBLY_ACC=CAM_ASM_001088 /TAXON_ID=426623 /ORGANISM="Chaetoceros affinis, Strain CCMP159" /LENGTH=792 /DNA_ID=CAMNT_0050540703 /DNA_START=133 /DNA_END=2511 /DNA_ORIENTATION=+
MTATDTSNENTAPPPGSEEDPYIWLEDVESDRSLTFAKESNAACLSSLGDPKTSSTGTYSKVLSILESNDRIAYVNKYGTNANGDVMMYNLWKDSKNPKGLWRKTTFESYAGGEDPAWETLLDIDALAEEDGISWVYKGNTKLPRALDPLARSLGGESYIYTRTLLSLSRGGADATYIKEFDLLSQKFVSPEGDGDDAGFALPEAKTRASYKSRNVLYVGSDFGTIGGKSSLTDSGYPRVIKEWVRGTSIDDAPVVFEGETTDVSVSAYLNDQRSRSGPIYEIRSRSMTFYTSRKWARRVKYEHLLAPDDPQRLNLDESEKDPEEFILLDVQDDASTSFVGTRMIITLRSDWQPIPDGTTYKSGSLLDVHADTFLTKGKEACTYHVLFEPTERTAYDGYTCTKNYLILSTLDNVKSKLSFYKIEDNDEDSDGSGFTFVGGDKEAQIRACDASAIDSTQSDDIWLHTSGYTQPSALSLGDASKAAIASTTDGADGDASAQQSYHISDLKSLPKMYNADDLVVSQKFATSEDGTQIPYFIIHKKDIVLDGTNPTLLYGYGGFEISLGPKYIATVGVAWLERGGVYVEANIRGGGEFGPSWHQAGLKANRHKCYEDFIAVGEDLVQSNICTPSTLAARGGSNGGLLMGMMYVSRPDLFGAIHCAVPLLDMKRFHTLLAGASWMAEYGDPDTSDWDDFLHKYSPYHLIDESNDKYPPMLVTTSTRDDRVHPAHARKMVKKLWDLSDSNGKKRDWPVYYYENIEGGHGGAADAKQSAFMTALAYDFMFDTLTKGSSS